jgi:lipoate-protein ligase B
MLSLENIDVGTGAPFLLRYMGRTDYQTCWQAMRDFTEARDETTPDEFWATEHNPVYTFGLAGKSEHLLHDNGLIPVIKTDRGGQITYHGPGQLVLYTMVDLRRMKLGVRRMVRCIEGAVSQWLAEYDIDAYGKEDAPGVYVRDRLGEKKIGALGLKVRNGRTYHGLSVNIGMDLTPFRDINPCGYAGLRVAQMSDYGAVPEIDEAARQLSHVLAEKLVTEI